MNKESAFQLWIRLIRWPTESEPTTLSRRTCVILALLIVLFQKGPGFVESYEPGLDESFQLHAATRWISGQGFTCLSDDDLADLAQPTYVAMTVWPPIWAFLAAGLLSLGLDQFDAGWTLWLIKTAVALAGTYGWLRLGASLLPAAGAGLFALGVSGLLFGHSPFGNAGFTGPSHLLVWSLVPWWLEAMLAGLAEGGGSSGLRAGLLAGLAVGLRFTGLALPAAGAAAILFASGRPIRQRLLTAGAAALPGVLMFAAIVAFNATQSDRAPWILSQAAPRPNAEPPKLLHPDNLVHRNLLTVWFGFGFGLEEVIFKLRPSWRVTAPFAVFLPWYGLMAISGAAAVGVLRRWREVSQTAPQPNGSDPPAEPSALVLRWQRMVTLTVLVMAALCGLVALAALRTDLAEQGFNPVAEQRYYTEPLPAVGLVWIGAWAVLLRAVLPSGLLPVGDPRYVLSFGAAPRVGLLVLAVGLVVTVAVLEARFTGAAFRGAMRRLRDANERRPLGETPLEVLIRETADRHSGVHKEGPPHRVFDSYLGSVRSVMWHNHIEIRFYSDSDALARSRCSRRTLVIVVERWEYDPGTRSCRLFGDTSNAWMHIRFWQLDSAAPLATMFDRGQVCRVWAGVVEPYEPGRPLPMPQVFEPPVVDESTPGFPGR